MKLFKVIIITLFVLIITMFSGCYYTQDNFSNVTVNEKITQSKCFALSSDSTELETSVRGAVFLSSGKEGIPEHIQIVALIEIDPEDWGGVSFYISENWHISGITSSYPEDETKKIPEDFVNIWRTGNTTVEWNKEVRIGTDSSYTPTGGGKGTIIIELDANKEIISTSDTFSMLIGVGSEEKDGLRIMNPDFERIEIPIL